jgi:putative intracellular protease/amidase
MRRSLVTLACAVLLAVSPSLRAAHAPHTTPEVRVGIVLFDGVQIIDFAGPYEVFGAAGFGVVTLSSDGGPVTTAMGLKVTPDAGFAGAPPFDVLLVPGGDVEDARQDPDVLAFVRDRAAGSRHVLSVCTGAYILAGAGVLDGLQATTFTPRLKQFAQLYPAVDVVRDVRWTDNGQVITSAGLSSGMDAALHLVARVRSTEHAQSTALHLEYDWKPEGGFVRSLMADRHVPVELETLVEWPEDLAMSREFSIGDERQWRMRFKVGTATPADALLQRVASGMDGIAGWTRQPGAYAWSSGQEGRQVVLSFEAVPGSDERDYRLVLHVQATPE